MPTLDEKQIELWTKTVAFVAVFVSVCGYLIITVRNSNFGFSTGDIIKPRVLAAGATFSLLCIIPTYLAHKMLPKERAQSAVDFAKKALALVAYLIEIYSLLLIKAVFFHADLISTQPAPFHVKQAVILLATLLFAGSAIYLNQRGGEIVPLYPKIITGCCVVCLTGALWVQAADPARSDAPSNIWLFLVGLAGSWLYRRVILKQLGFSSIALLAYLVPLTITSYADMVFPHIYQRWGGGQPVPIAISILDKGSSKPSDLVGARLLDQDSSGIFVEYGNVDVAVFVPKDNIARVCYLEHAQPHQLSEVFMPSLPLYEQKPLDTAGCSP